MVESLDDWVDKGSYGGGFVPSEMYVNLSRYYISLTTTRDEYEGDQTPEATSMRVPSNEWRVSGPLTISAIALFSNTSWYHNAVAYAANTTYEDVGNEDSRDESSLAWQ